MCFPRLRTRERSSPRTVSLGMVPAFDVSTRPDPMIVTPTVQFLKTTAPLPKNRKRLPPSSPSSSSVKRSRRSNPDLKYADELVSNARRRDQRSDRSRVLLLDGSERTADSSGSKEDTVLSLGEIDGAGGTLNIAPKGILDNALEKNLDDEHSDTDYIKAVEYLQTRKLYLDDLNDSLDAEIAVLHRKREELKEWTKSFENRIRATSLVLTELLIESASIHT